MPIWNKLPPEERRKYIHARLTPGRVILLHCDFTRPHPKDKFLLVASLDPDPLFFVINSKLTDFIRRNEHLIRCQVAVDHKTHPFLQHESYINCTEAYEIGMDEIYRQLEADVNRIKSDITDSVRTQILAAVKLSKTLSPKHKSDILSALNQGA